MFPGKTGEWEVGQERKRSKGVISDKVPLGSSDTMRITAQRVLTGGELS